MDGRKILRGIRYGLAAILIVLIFISLLLRWFTHPPGRA
jgi:hypothetical protein